MNAIRSKRLDWVKLRLKSAMGNLLLAQRELQKLHAFELADYNALTPEQQSTEEFAPLQQNAAELDDMHTTATDAINNLSEVVDKIDDVQQNL